MSLEEAHLLCPEIDIQGIINRLAGPQNHINRVIVTSPQYLIKLSQLIQSTPRVVIQNYFLWKAIQTLGDYIESSSMLPYKQFSKELQGKVEFMIVWKLHF
jgi:endothelin-converting enzyme